ncbi:uncharacterized protein KY384_006388 [Bacidia gigantensis]|uniref:uncharacterized protein n=1 Tax=Bacidia gigantensis TaxID=2732470 RepID=UPI001D03FAA2|nr:uncharacterized protein KY384_006388 [Bacidia gigantensis]KAG8528701.1 hypothetical protein KY384_006388 [Bacidia gigantensis]
MGDSTTTATLENLSRLASKPGVQSTLILSKKNGSIIRSTGLLASASASTDNDQALSNGTSHATDAGPSDMGGELEGRPKTKTAEEIAKSVMMFVEASNIFAQGMQDGDEVRLLRTRTKKNEIVIVPGE